jgi:hypothetical protein
MGDLEEGAGIEVVWLRGAYGGCLIEGRLRYDMNARGMAQKNDRFGHNLVGLSKITAQSDRYGDWFHSAIPDHIT